MPKTSLNPWLATAELLIAAMFWGFGFIAARWALTTFNGSEITFLRFAIAAVIGVPFVWRASVRVHWRAYARASLIPAALLFGTLIFQTWGLKYTSATKSGFITTLYVVFVPLLEALLGRKPMPRSLWLCVLMAVVGTALIVDLGLHDLNWGDVLTLICAFIATAQIYWMGLVSPRITQPFAFNFFQVYWATLLCWPLVFGSGLPDKFLNASIWPWTTWAGLLSLSVGSTVIAFSLQVRAQRRLSPTVSSLVFLLESPFAMFFAQIFLAESLSGLELVGALLIFCSALVATFLEARAQ